MHGAMGATTTTPIDETAAWAAVEARDERLDGAFVYGVSTTRIYCRPTCPSRRPRREHAAFFASPTEAELAGYRACRRCAPRAEGGSAAARTADRVRAAIDRQLADAPDRAVTLAGLAGVVGLSPHHLQRTFKRATGLTPAEYVRAARGERLRAGLRAGETVTGALFGAGYGSTSRVYASDAAVLGMTPGVYRRGGAGVRVRYLVAQSPLGRVLVAATERGVCAVTLGDDEAALVEALAAEYPRAALVRAAEPEPAGPDDAVPLRHWAAAVVAYLAGDADTLDLPTDVGGTAFQRRVWAALQAIPRGETRSYAELAAALGEPAAVRAVAGACARNRVAVVIPCHRVLRTGGALGGFRWGLERKRALLAREGVASVQRAGPSGDGSAERRAPSA